jgi:antitoxin MazE
MRIIKWGDSLAVRIPAAVAEALRLKEGDDIEICIADRPEMEVSRKPSRDELLKRLRAFRGRLPADFKFGREKANAGSFLDTNVLSVRTILRSRSAMRKRQTFQLSVIDL